MKKHLFAILLTALGVAILIAGCGKSPSKIRKECYINQRYIQGAIEMYNMDHDEPIRELKHSMVLEGGVLVERKYLKKAIEPPHEKCHYGTTAGLSLGGNITCEYHGSFR